MTLIRNLKDFDRIATTEGPIADLRAMGFTVAWSVNREELFSGIKVLVCVSLGDEWQWTSVRTIDQRELEGWAVNRNAEECIAALIRYEPAVAEFSELVKDGTPIEWAYAYVTSKTYPKIEI